MNVKTRASRGGPTPTVLITDCDMGPADLERDVLEAAGYRVVHGSCKTPNEVIDAIQEHDAVGLLVQYAPVTAQVMHACPQVRALFRYGVGMDNIDTGAARELGVVAQNVPDYGSAEVADHAMTLLLSLLRAIPSWSAATSRGEWPIRGDFREPLELRECTLGLLGFGAIAREVSRRALAFDMTVQVHDPYVPATNIRDAGALPVELDDLWRSSTAISLHVPLTTQTEGVVNEHRLSQMRPGSFLVNTARAGLIDRSALQDALRSGQLAGVGLDVWWQEPAPADDILTRDARVLLTPHIAWMSPGATRRLRTYAAQRLLDALTIERNS